MGDIVQDEEGQEFELDTRSRARGSSGSTFGGMSLRAALGRAASTRSILSNVDNRDALARALVAIGAVSESESTGLTMEKIRPMFEVAMSMGAISLTPFERNLRPLCDIEKVEPAQPLTEGMPEEELAVTHTLEIELVDDNDEPVPEEPYRVELPDGEIVNGRLNKLGKALLTGIRSSGNCKVTFPRLDQSVWGPG